MPSIFAVIPSGCSGGAVGRRRHEAAMPTGQSAGTPMRRPSPAGRHASPSAARITRRGAVDPRRRGTVPFKHFDHNGSCIVGQLPGERKAARVHGQAAVLAVLGQAVVRVADQRRGHIRVRLPSQHGIRPTGGGARRGGGRVPCQGCFHRYRPPMPPAHVPYRHDQRLQRGFFCIGWRIGPAGYPVGRLDGRREVEQVIKRGACALVGVVPFCGRPKVGEDLIFGAHRRYAPSVCRVAPCADNAARIAPHAAKIQPHAAELARALDQIWKRHSF